MVQARRIARRGIQFGPELTEEEKKSGKTIHDRGLLFICYQTSITNGFQFLQQCESGLFFEIVFLDPDLIFFSVGGQSELPSFH